jgi:hypothetical protein
MEIFSEGVTFDLKMRMLTVRLLAFGQAVSSSSVKDTMTPLSLVLLIS